MSELKISDELLARYIDNRATAEETAKVERCLAEDQELLDEFIAVAEAARLADSKPVTAPSMEKAKTDTLSVIHCGKTVHRPVWIHYTAAAAAVAAVLILVQLFVKPFGHDTEQQFASNDTPIHQQSEGQQPENTFPETVVHANGNSDKMSETTVQDTDNTQKNTTETPLDEKVISIQRVDKSYASTAEAKPLSMVKPSRPVYRVLCKNLDKAFTFQWTSANVKQLNFVLKNKKGEIVLQSQDADATRLDVSYRKLYPETEFLWFLSVTYTDDSREQRSGNLMVDYEVN